MGMVYAINIKESKICLFFKIALTIFTFIFIINENYFDHFHFDIEYTTFYC